MSSPLLPLEAGEPHPSLAPEHQLFAPFIGSWDLDVTWHEGDEVVRREDGEWHFAWVLEGRAVQDVWIVPRRGLREDVADPYEYGTSLRFYDPEIDAWHSTWIGPTQHLVRTFVARRVGDDVVLDTRLEDGRRVRWAFADITPDSFTWSNATEDGGTWAVTQRFRARRA
jgi:hypothetical protein